MYATMKDWEKEGLEKEIDLYEGAAAGTQHVRMNGCPAGAVCCASV